MNETVFTTKLWHMVIKPVNTLARAFIAQPSSPFFTVAILPRHSNRLQSMKLQGLQYSPKSFEAISDQ